MYSIDDIYFSTAAPVFQCNDRGELLGELSKSEIEGLGTTEVLRIEPFINGKEAALKVVLGRRKTNRIL